MSDERSSQINILSIFERVVKLEGSQTALHGRLDKNELSTRESMSEILRQQAEIIKDLKEVIGWMNRGKGWAAATVLMGGIVGAGIVTAIRGLFKA
jgi:hypothetical protein